YRIKSRVTIIRSIDGVAGIAGASPVAMPRACPEEAAMNPASRIALLSLLAVAALTAPATAQLAGQTIAIAVVGPLSGGAAALGTEQRQAVEMAVDEKNAAGGVLGARVALVSADDRADAAEGKAIAQRLCDDARVLGVVGHVNSGVSIEASGVYGACRL